MKLNKFYKLYQIDCGDNQSNREKNGERNALYLLRDDASIIKKEADIGSVVVVWDQEDYLREANKILSDRDVYREVKGDAKVLLGNL